MERIGRDNTRDDQERIRDRTQPRKKRRFDSGPDPEKIKSKLTSREQESDRATPGKEDNGPQLAKSSASKSISYTGSDKHAKRAYIGNIPLDTDQIDLQ